MDITIVDNPTDEAPPLSDETVGWFDPDYPHSTAEHPYGYFPKADGTPDFDRPRKRRPHGARTVGSSTAKAVTANPKKAQMAASVLAQMNNFLGMGLMTFGLPLTAAQLAEKNIVFEGMAADALASDPELCRRILAGGASSGRAQLAVAYAILAGTVGSQAVAEIKTRKEEANVV